MSIPDQKFFKTTPTSILKRGTLEQAVKILNINAVVSISAGSINIPSIVDEFKTNFPKFSVERVLINKTDSSTSTSKNKFCSEVVLIVSAAELNFDIQLIEDVLKKSLRIGKLDKLSFYYDNNVPEVATLKTLTEVLDGSLPKTVSVTESTGIILKQQSHVEEFFNISPPPLNPKAKEFIPLFSSLHFINNCNSACVSQPQITQLDTKATVSTAMSSQANNSSVSQSKLRLEAVPFYPQSLFSPQTQPVNTELDETVVQMPLLSADGVCACVNENKSTMVDEITKDPAYLLEYITGRIINNDPQQGEILEELRNALPKSDPKFWDYFVKFDRREYLEKLCFVKNSDNQIIIIASEFLNRIEKLGAFMFFFSGYKDSFGDNEAFNNMLNEFAERQDIVDVSSMYAFMLGRLFLQKNDVSNEYTKPMVYADLLKFHMLPEKIYSGETDDFVNAVHQHVNEELGRYSQVRNNY